MNIKNIFKSCKYRIFSLVALTFFSINLNAQVVPGTEAPLLKTMSAVDSHGIDLISGDALIPGVNMSIGSSESGIAISDNSFNGMRMQYKGAIVYIETTANEGGCEALPPGKYFSVSTGKDTVVFKHTSGSDPELVRGKGQLKWGSEILYRDLGGTEYKYETFSISDGFSATVSNNPSGCNFQKPIATLTKITKPNGEVVDINYLKGPVIYVPFIGSTQLGYFTSVQSNLGWIFKQESVSQSGDVTTSAGGKIQKEFIFANLSEEYCNPSSSGSCRSLTKAWPKFQLEENYSKVGTETAFQTISYKGDLLNPLGKKTVLNYNFTEGFFVTYDTIFTSPTGLIKKYKRRCPGGADDYVQKTCSDVKIKPLESYTQGAASFSYGVNLLTSSSYANQYIIPRDAWGPDGKVRYVPALSQYPTHFYDNLSREYVQDYQSTSKWLLEQVGYLNDSKAKAVYDSRGNITSVSQLSKITGEASIVTTLTYPPESTCITSPKTCNKPDTITNQAGVTTTYTYDSNHGGVLTETKPAINGVQAQIKYSYEQKTPYVKNSSGSLVANSPVWRLVSISKCMTMTLNTCAGTSDEQRTEFSNFTNNLLPRTTTTKLGDGSISLSTTTEYDIYGNVISVDGPRPGTYDTTYYFYDLMRQKTGEIGTDPDGSGPRIRQATRITYNDDGKVFSVEKGKVSGTTESDLKNAMTVLDKQTIEYDSAGLPSVERYFVGNSTTPVNVTQKSYNKDLRLECVAQRLNPDNFNSLPASACTLGNPGAEGNDRITKYTYDLAGALKKTTSAYGTSLARDDRVNTYDPKNGLLSTEADGRGNITTYQYDNYNRLFKTIYPMPDSGTTPSSTDYTQTNYRTGSSLVESVRLRDGLSISFGYDALGRTETKSGAISESFTYNNFNQVRIHTNNTTGGVVAKSSFAYNALGWSTSETRFASGASLGNVSYLYDSYGRRSRLKWSDGFYVNYDYMVSGYAGDYLQSIKESSGAALATFVYDDYGRRKSMTRGNGVVTSYDYYDNRSRLKTLSTDVVGGTADDISETFGYTTAGQLKSRVLNAANSNYAYIPAAAGITNYIPNALNQIKTVNAGSAVSLEYDNRGNLNIDNTTSTSYTYNADNLLLNAKQGDVTTTLSYDAEKRLYSVSKSGTTTKFVYDGNKLIAETDGSNNILRRYVPGPGTDEPIVWFEGSGTNDKRYPTTDRLGSIVGMTSSTGTNLFINTYDEYGIPKSTNQGRYQYTGQTWLPEIGLYYYKARFYNPKLGRFMQTDPIGYKDGMNWYAYTGNDPVNYIDTTGNVRYKADHSGVVMADLIAKGVAAFTEPGSAANNAANQASVVTEKAMKAYADEGATKRNKAPTHGNAQKTFKNGVETTHASTSQQVAQNEAKRDDAKSVHLNQTVSTITNGEVQSAVRPDVATVRTDGKIDVTEVLSPKQTEAQMTNKITNALGDRCGTITCVK